MATTPRLPFFLLALVVLSIPPWSAASLAQLDVDDQLVARPPSAEETPHWLSPTDASLINRWREHSIVADAVVSLDGKGNYTTIAAAIAAAPVRSTTRHVVHVKAGFYKEYINITSEVWNLMLVGDGMEETIISGDHSNRAGYGTMYSGTVTVSGIGFIARDLRIENTAGAANGQAVALMIESDRSVVYRCSLRGYQDTLYAKSYWQFYRACEISGTIDFIFGDAAAVFQNCSILARRPNSGQANTITAQGRNNGNTSSGFTFQFCKVAADDELVHANFTVNTYLGRPWKNYSRVVFMQSFLSDVVHPDGWLRWDEKTPLDRLYYAELNNRGPGANVSNRVHWPGVHRMIGAAEASKFTVKNFIGGNDWLPSTGVSYTPGL